MSNGLTGINMVLALAVGVLTFVVAKRVLKTVPMLNSPVIPFCVAGLTAVSLSNTGIVNALLVPYGALGLALLFIFLIYPFLNDKKRGIRPRAHEPRETGEKEDPWEKEMRRRKQIVKRRRLK